MFTTRMSSDTGEDFIRLSEAIQGEAGQSFRTLLDSVSHLIIFNYNFTTEYHNHDKIVYYAI
jgi:hypothetical protein